MIFLDILDGSYQDALDKLGVIQDEVMTWATDYAPKDVIRGFIHILLGEPDTARTYYMNARILLEKKLAEWPNDTRIIAQLGRVYAYLGFHEDAIREGEKAVDLISVTKDAMEGPVYLVKLAEIYLIAVENEQAIDILESLIKMPYGETESYLSFLEIHPVWNPLRTHPRFQKLLEDRRNFQSIPEEHE